MFTIFLLSILFCISIYIIFKSYKKKTSYIANEGFLIQSWETKILIDGLFELENESEYESPSSETIFKIVNNISPFDNISYLLISHNHKDHFNITLTLDLLKNNKHSKIICQSQIKSELISHKLFNYNDRIIELYPESDSLINDSTNIFIKVFK